MSLSSHLFSFLPAFLGAAVSLNFVGEKMTKLQALLYVLCGTVSSIYLTPIALNMITFVENAEYGVAFLVGLVAMKLLEGVSAAAGIFAKKPENFLIFLKKGKH